MSSSSSTVAASVPAPPGLPSVRRGRVLRGVSAPVAALSVIEARPKAREQTPAEAAEVERGYADGSERGYSEGFDRGYQDGLAAGRAAMAAEVDAARARLTTAAGALTAAAGELSRRQAVELSQLEDVVAGLAYEIASAVIGREVAASATPAADALARALALTPPAAAAIARFHPDDVAVMEVAVPLDRPVTVVPDPAVEPGGCVVDVGDCRIDAQISAALDRVRRALLGDGGATS